MKYIIVLFAILCYYASNSLDEGYAYQTGHISLNDSEITILINSTFEIIEDFDNDTLILGPENEKSTKLPATSTSTVPTTTTTTPTTSRASTKKRRMRMKKIKPSLINCQQYTEAEKYKILERAGGRNQYWMADSVDEAAQNFADFYSQGSTIGEPLHDSVGTSNPGCDSRCQMIKSTLNAEIARRNQSQVPLRKMKLKKNQTIFLNDAVSETCSLGSFLPVGNCSELGEPVDGDHEALCSECNGVYMLSSNCFPQIFNAIHCNSQEMGCIFDSITDMAHGQCGIQTLAFKVLRNVGDANCEDWKVDYIQLPVSCQCSLSKNSFLRSSPTKEL